MEEFKSEIDEFSNSKGYLLLNSLLTKKKFSIEQLSELLEILPREIQILLSEIDSFLTIRSYGSIELNLANKFSLNMNSKQNIIDILSNYKAYVNETSCMVVGNSEIVFKNTLTESQNKLLKHLVLKLRFKISYEFSKLGYSNIGSIFDDLNVLRQFLEQYDLGALSFHDGIVSYSYSDAKYISLIRIFSSVVNFNFEVIEDEIDYNFLHILLNEKRVLIHQLTKDIGVDLRLLFSRRLKFNSLMESYSTDAICLNEDSMSLNHTYNSLFLSKIISNYERTVFDTDQHTKREKERLSVQAEIKDKEEITFGSNFEIDKIMEYMFNGE